MYPPPPHLTVAPQIASEVRKPGVEVDLGWATTPSFRAAGPYDAVELQGRVSGQRFWQI